MKLTRKHTVPGGSVSLTYAIDTTALIKDSSITEEELEISIRPILQCTLDILMAIFLFLDNRHFHELVVSRIRKALYTLHTKLTEDALIQLGKRLKDNL